MAATSFRVVRAPDAGEAAAAALLVEALRRGDARAQLEAWNRFSPAADGTLRRLLGPGAEREDLLQEVFIRFFRRIGTLREAAAVRGFLTAICLRVAQAEIARRRRHRWLHLTDTGDAPEGAGSSPDGDAREAVARYYRLLETLGRDRSLFVARTIEGLPLDQVAALHRVSVSTAQRRIKRATARVAALVRRDPVLMTLANGGQP
jgi:RNA polymerase sigma-70 factor (ECF subfamily)